MMVLSSTVRMMDSTMETMIEARHPVREPFMWSFFERDEVAPHGG